MMSNTQVSMASSMSTPFTSKQFFVLSVPRMYSSHSVRAVVSFHPFLHSGVWNNDFSQCLMSGIYTYGIIAIHNYVQQLQRLSDTAFALFSGTSHKATSIFFYRCHKVSVVIKHDDLIFNVIGVYSFK